MYITPYLVLQLMIISETNNSCVRFEYLRQLLFKNIIFSEEKAKLLREVGSHVDERDTELAQFLASLSLDASVLNPEPFRLPQHLLEKCAALSIKPDTIQELKKAMTGKEASLLLLNYSQRQNIY